MHSSVQVASACDWQTAYDQHVHKTVIHSPSMTPLPAPLRPGICMMRGQCNQTYTHNPLALYLPVQRATSATTGPVQAVLCTPATRTQCQMTLQFLGAVVAGKLLMPRLPGAPAPSAPPGARPAARQLPPPPPRLRSSAATCPAWPCPPADHAGVSSCCCTLQQHPASCLWQHLPYISNRQGSTDKLSQSSRI